jgi:hypothetical protein
MFANSEFCTRLKFATQSCVGRREGSVDSSTIEDESSSDADAREILRLAIARSSFLLPGNQALCLARLNIDNDLSTTFLYLPERLTSLHHIPL